MQIKIKRHPVQQNMFPVQFITITCQFFHHHPFYSLSTKWSLMPAYLLASPLLLQVSASTLHISPVSATSVVQSSSQHIAPLAPATAISSLPTSSAVVGSSYVLSTCEAQLSSSFSPMIGKLPETPIERFDTILFTDGQTDEEMAQQYHKLPPVGLW